MIKKISITTLILSFSLLCIYSCTPENNEQPLQIDKLTGNWICQDEEKQEKNTYRVNIKSGNSDTEELLLYNFAQIGEREYATATVIGDIITIPLQKILTVDVFGKGTIIGNNRIEWEFNVSDQADRRDYIAIFKRQ